MVQHLQFTNVTEGILELVAQYIQSGLESNNQTILAHLKFYHFTKMNSPENTHTQTFTFSSSRSTTRFTPAKSTKINMMKTKLTH